MKMFLEPLETLELLKISMILSVTYHVVTPLLYVFYQIFLPKSFLWHFISMIIITLTALLHPSPLNFLISLTFALQKPALFHTTCHSSYIIYLYVQRLLSHSQHFLIRSRWLLLTKTLPNSTTFPNKIFWIFHLSCLHGRRWSRMLWSLMRGRVFDKSIKHENLEHERWVININNIMTKMSLSLFIIKKW